MFTNLQSMCHATPPPQVRIPLPVQSARPSPLRRSRCTALWTAIAVRFIDTTTHNGTDRLEKMWTFADLWLLGQESATLPSELPREPLPEVIGETAPEGVEVLA